MSGTDGEIRTERDGHILIMTADRIAKRNAFTPRMLHQLADALTDLDETDDLWVGVLLFAGEHATGGLDMPLFFGPDAGDPMPPETKVDPFALRRRCRTPVVTAVQGICYTVGIELMLAGDIVVAADDCRFSQLEPKRGLAALGGAPIRFVERGGWGNAMYHLLRADVFDATEALRCGLVQEVVPAGTQRERALAIAREIAANAPLAVQETKASSMTAARDGEQAAIDGISAMRDRLLATEDLVEGLASFVERRDANFSGR